MSFELHSIRSHYQFEPHFLTVRGHSLHFVDEGDGPPILMLHGNPSWSIMYRGLIRALRDSHRVVVPDHIGCGLSQKPPTSEYGYRLEDRVMDLETLLQQVGLTADLSLVVHDWGGPIGFTLATRHPSWFKRILVLNTAAFLLPAGKHLPPLLSFFRSSLLAPALIRGLNLFSLLALHLGCRKKPMSKELRKAYQRPYDSWNNRVAILRFVQDIPLSEGDSSYATLRQTESNLSLLSGLPMLLCWGMRDPVFDASFLERWRSLFPRAEVVCFQEAGHYLLEDEEEPICQLARNFFGELADESGPAT